MRARDELTDPLPRDPSPARIDLYWLPLGAGARIVRLSGRAYEAVKAFLEGRRPLDLYHAALEVRVPEGRFVIEMTPIPDVRGASRGVVREGPVGTRGLGRFRMFRYELRRWRDGAIPDREWAIAGPQCLSDHPGSAHRLLDLVPFVPRLVWGRDELGAGDMWNSNSMISWLLAQSGLPADAIRPPAGGRAPGWEAGLVAARSMIAPAGRSPVHRFIVLSGRHVPGPSGPIHVDVADRDAGRVPGCGPG